MRMRLRRAVESPPPPLDNACRHFGGRSRHTRRRHLAGAQFANDALPRRAVLVHGICRNEPIQGNPGRLHPGVVAADAVAFENGADMFLEFLIPLNRFGLGPDVPREADKYSNTCRKGAQSPHYLYYDGSTLY